MYLPQAYEDYELTHSLKQYLAHSKPWGSAAEHGGDQPGSLTRTFASPAPPPPPPRQVEAIEYYTKLEQKLKEDYKREKEKVNEKPLGMAFVTFHNETITAM